MAPGTMSQLNRTSLVDGAPARKFATAEGARRPPMKRSTQPMPPEGTPPGTEVMVKGSPGSRSSLPLRSTNAANEYTGAGGSRPRLKVKLLLGTASIFVPFSNTKSGAPKIPRPALMSTVSPASTLLSMARLPEMPPIS